MPTLPAKLNRKKNSLIPTLLCFFVVFIMVSLLTNLPITIVLAISTGFIAILLYITLSKQEKSWIISFPASFPLIFIGIYIFFLIIFIYSPTSDLMFLNWNSFNSIILLQFVALVLLTSFFPGYLIMKIFMSQTKIDFSASIVFSFLIGTFSLSIISLLMALFIDSWDLYTKFVTLAFNVILLISYLFLNRKGIRHPIKPKISISYEKLLISALIIFVLISVYITYFSILSSPRSDCFSHIGGANKILKGIFPWEMGGTLTYPFLFHINLATIFSMSSLPIVNSYMLLIPFISLIPLSFYSMLKSFNKLPKKIPVVATTFFTLGSGLGWIYVTYLQTLYPSINNEIWKYILNISVNPTLIDIQFGAVGLSIWGYQPSVIGLVVFCGLTYLFQSEISNKFTLLMITLLVCYGYLIHISEIVLFVFIILTSFIVIKKSQFMTKLRKKIFAVSFGLIAAYLLIFTLNTTLQENLSVYSTPVIMILCYLAFLTIVSFIKEKIRVKINLKLSDNLLPSFGLLSIISLVCLIGLSFIIWLKVYPTFLFSYVSESGLLPWYFYPLRIGIIGIIGLLMIGFLVFKNKLLSRDLMFFIFLTLIAFSIGRAISFVNINFPLDIGYWEFRIVPFAFIGLAVLASFCCYLSFKNSSIWHLRKKIFASLLLGILILTSVMSTIYSVEHWTLQGYATNDDYDALNYLNSRDLYSSEVTSRSFPVLTVSSRGSQFSRLTGITTFPYPELLFKPSNSEMFTSLVSSTNAKYVYLSKGDYEILNSSYPSGFFSQFLLDYYPRSHLNNATVIEIPHFSTSKTTADLGIIRTPGPSSINRLISYSVALSELDYSILENFDPELFESKQIILPSDLSYIEIPFEDNWTISKDLNFSKNNDSVNISIKNDGKQILGSDADITFNSIPLDNQMAISLNIKVKLGTNDWIGIGVYDLDKKVWEPLGSIYSDKGNPPGWASPVPVENEKWTEIDFNVKGDKIEKIGGIFFRFLTLPGSSQSFELNRLIISDYESMMFPTDKFINWVENGGHLIIFDDHPGYFSNLLNIRQTDTSIANCIANIEIPDTVVPVTSSILNNLDVLGYYLYNNKIIAPYAYSMDFGKGKLIYFEISAYLDNIESSENELKYELLTNFSRILQSLDEFTIEKPNMKAYPIMTELGNFSGQVKMTTNVFLPEESTLLWDNIVTSGSNVIVDGKEIKNFSIENAQLSEFSILGKSNSSINSTIMKITPEQSGYYFKFKFEKGFNWTLNLNSNSILKFKIIDGINTINVQIEGGTVEFIIKKGITSVIKTPKIFVNGIAQFQSAYFWLPFDWLGCFGNPITLKGDMYFATELTDSGTVLFSDFNINGTKEVDHKPTTKWNEWDIPWFDVFLSLENLVLIMIMIVLIQQVYFRNKYNSKNKIS